MILDIIIIAIMNLIIILDDNYYNEFDEPIKINSQYNNNYYNELNDPLKTNFQ